MTREKTSPYNNQPAPIGGDRQVAWSPVADLLTPASNLQVQTYLNRTPDNAFNY
jgi:hypothetical protein